MKSMSTPDVICHGSNKFIPILTSPDNVTPTLVRTWERVAINHFRTKEIPDSQWVTKSLAAFRNPNIEAWIDSNYDRMSAPDFMFATFMSELRDAFLDANWAIKIRRKMNNELMKKYSLFTNWVQVVTACNMELSGTEHHLDPMQLHAFMYERMTKFLQERCDNIKSELDNILEFNKWAACIQKLNNSH